MIEEINHKEYVSRQIKAQKLMEERDLQALLITNATNLFISQEPPILVK